MKLLILPSGSFTIEDLKYFSNVALETGLSINLIGWENQSGMFELYCKAPYSLIKDPQSFKDLNGRYININRQIAHWRYIMDVYDPSIQVLKCRSDTRFKSIKNLAYVINILQVSSRKAIVTNVTTASPRFINIAQLTSHISDWFIIGILSDLKKILTLEYLNEKLIICKKPFRNRLIRQSRSIQNEQALWSEHENVFSKFLIFNNFQLGLESCKYPNKKIYSLFSPYTFLRMSLLECLIHNHGFSTLLLFYIPFMRLAGLIPFVLIKNRTKIYPLANI